MRRSILVATLFASAAISAQANDGVELSLKTKAAVAAATSVVPHPASAPYAPGRDPLPALFFEQEQEEHVAGARPGSCELSKKDVCYDLADGRIVYRPAREYMPKFEGLKPESISVRSNRIVFKYSFR